MSSQERFADVGGKESFGGFLLSEERLPLMSQEADDGEQ